MARSQHVLKPSVGPSEFDSLATLEQVFAHAVREDPALRAEMEARLHPYHVTLKLGDLTEWPDRIEATLELRAPTSYRVKVHVTKDAVVVRLVERPQVRVTIPVRPDWRIVPGEVTATQRNGSVNVEMRRERPSA